MTNEQLILEAKKAKEYSYAPYSKFNVGAALLTTDGKVYHGCNIENGSYGATNCAERTAIFKAVSEGDKNFEKIAIVSTSGEETFPCGICLQVMNEFAPNIEVVLENEKSGEITTYSLKELLPKGFVLEDN